MWTYPTAYDCIVIGAGHAGCEAALAAARMGQRTLLLTMNLDTVAKMSCNPAIGGIAKGHMVREIDALGGEMGRATDRASIQSRMLNRSRGPAVWAPRAQCDRVVYQFDMKRRIEETPNLELKAGTTERLLVTNGKIEGVVTGEGIAYRARTVILSSGTFMRGLMHVGEASTEGGRAGDRPAVGISASLLELGFKLGRLKTGTPPRIHRRSIDFSGMEEQFGEEGIRFAYEPEDFEPLPQRSCFLTYTTPKTHQIIRDNLHRSPMYSGKIEGIGTRYCPSIEDKVVRFCDKERHQVIIEPEGLTTEELYINGISSSLPFDVQLQFVRSILGLARAEIMRPAYAVEYDYVVSGQLLPSLETQGVEGLFLAGQVNGTSGYEEAAAQGLIAGINAARKVQQKPPLILKRSESYIGVMIDDLVAKGVDEPYRMFTSRAEHRLLLRQDNADLRLTPLGYEMGLISKERYERVERKRALVGEEIARLERRFKQVEGKGYSLLQLLARPESSYWDLRALYPEDITEHPEEIRLQIELHAKYAGYLKRQEEEVARLERIEEAPIPADFDFQALKPLRTEARQKFSKVRPATVGQASRIPGITPADISILLVALK
ncbi:MAG: tRNA uridine-5-carboxymethylaminomethyl(34) synthesis enzyme MnmG [Parachlamydiales bacterium]